MPATGNDYGIIGWYPQLTAPTSLSPTTKSFTTSVQIQLSDPQVDIQTITSYPLFPYRFKQYPQYPQFFCIDWNLDQPISHPDIRMLTATWSTEIPKALIRNGKPVWDDNPIARPLDVSVSYYNHPRTCRMTYDMKKTFDPTLGFPVPTIPVTTTAGEPIFLQFEDERRIFNCTKNVKKLPKFMAKGGTFINSDMVTFQGVTFPKYNLLLCNTEVSAFRFEFGVAYCVWSYKLMVSMDSDGWCEKLRNAGYHERAYEKKVNDVGTDTETTDYIPYLKAIEVGKLEAPHYPSSPVLISPSGKAYRAPGVGQSKTTPFDQRTGPVLSTEGDLNNGYGITPKMFQDAELKFYPRIPISFSKYVPLS